MKVRYRQGDVPIVETSSIPDDAKVVKRDSGRVVLAYGEVTGHAHAINDAGCALLEASDGARYLRVEDVELVLEPLKVLDRQTHDVQMADGTIVRFEPDVFTEAQRAIRKSKTLSVRGVLIKHEEHSAVVVEPGNYKLPGQREYVAPEIERRVAD